MEKTYVEVNSKFDATGYMLPLSIVWNGHVYPIEEVKSYRPASSLFGQTVDGSCYTVVVGGEEKHLFFEKTNPQFSSHVGRWYMESKK